MRCRNTLCLLLTVAHSPDKRGSYKRLTDSPRCALQNTLCMHALADLQQPLQETFVPKWVCAVHVADLTVTHIYLSSD